MTSPARSRAVRLASITLVFSIAALIALARSAGACSLPYEPPEPACTRITLVSPGTIFPQNLANELRVVAMAFNGFAYSGIDFPQDAPLHVSRETASGWVDVPFTLTEEPHLVANARALHLASADPGRYVASWEGALCAQAASPDGRGTLIGELTLTEERPLPTSLGQPAARPREVVPRTFDLGIDADCSSITARATVARTPFELSLPEDVKPWAATLSVAIYIDGEIYRGFAQPDPRVADTGVIDGAIERICTADAALDRQPKGPSEGEHELKLAARIGDLATIESAPTTLRISCAPAGCSAAEPSGSALVLLAAVLTLCAWRRFLRGLVLDLIFLRGVWWSPGGSNIRTVGRCGAAR